MIDSQPWSEASTNNPCPLCQKPDWCSISGNGKAVLCRRTESAPGGWKVIKQSKDGFPIFAVEEQKAVRPKQTRHWEYPDRNGNPLVRIWRVDDGNGKTARWQERWCGEYFKKGLEGVQREDVPIYRYREVRQAVEDGKTIFIVEGEVCADALWDIGVPATTNIGGAGKWTESDTTDLTGAAAIVISPDRDQPGLKHALELQKLFPNTQYLIPYPQSHAWKNLPNSQGVDVADWIADFNLTSVDIMAAVVPSLPIEEKPFIYENSTKELTGVIEALIAKDLSESALQKELIQVAKAEKQSLQALRALHDAIAQEGERSTTLKDSLPQLEKLLQYNKKQTDWAAILPGPLFKALKTKAEADRIELIYLIQSLLPAVAGLIGSSVGIVCKEGESLADHWIEFPIIWTTIIAQPSAGKSNADRAIFNPILKMQDTDADRHERDKQELARLEKQWEKESKEGKAELYDSFDNPANFREGISPARKFLIDEGEIEAVKRRISEQLPGTGVTWNSDELLSIFKGLDQYKNGRGNGRQFLLKAWNAPLSGYVDRVNESESFRFKGQCLSLCGGIQIGPAAQFFNPDGQNLDEDGLRSRVLVAVPQLHEDFDRWNDSKVNLNPLLSDLYQKVLKAPKGLVYLSPEASVRWHRQWEKYRKGLKQNTNSNPAFAYFLGKMCSNLMRLALVLHTIEHCYVPKFDFFTLDLETLNRAISMADFYVTQFRLAQSMFTSSPDQGMSEFLLNILNLCIKEGSLAPYQVVDRWRRKSGKGGKPIRAADVKEMFAVIAEARPQQVRFDGKKLIALEKHDRVLENTYKTRSPDRANKPLQDKALTEKHDQHDRFSEEKSEIFDDFSLETRSCLYVKSPQTPVVEPENGTIRRSCFVRVSENPIVFSEPPPIRGEHEDTASNQGSSLAVAGSEPSQLPVVTTEKPDRVSEKPDRVFEIDQKKPDRVFEENDRVLLETKMQSGNLRVGDIVRYRRSAPGGAVKVTCAHHPLKVLAFRPGEAFVKRSTWAEPMWLEQRYLDFCSRGEDANLTEGEIEDLEELGIVLADGDEDEILPPDYSDEDLEDMAESGFTHIPSPQDEQVKELNQWCQSISTAVENYSDFAAGSVATQAEQKELKKGDRVTSLVSWKDGQIEKVNSRWTYILWDNDKQMGLPAMQYSLSDIETMRIVKKYPDFPSKTPSVGFEPTTKGLEIPCSIP